MELENSTILSIIVGFAGILAEVIFHNTLNSSVLGMILGVILAVVILCCTYFALDGISYSISSVQKKEQRRKREYDEKMYRLLNKRLADIVKLEKGIYARLVKRAESDENLSALEDTLVTPETLRELATQIDLSTTKAAKMVAKYGQKEQAEANKALHDAIESVLECLNVITSEVRQLEDQLDGMKSAADAAAVTAPVELPKAVESELVGGFQETPAAEEVDFADSDSSDNVDIDLAELDNTASHEEETEQVQPEPAPMPDIDLSDPNKELSVDEIDALFAAAGLTEDTPAEPAADKENLSEASAPEDSGAELQTDTVDTDILAELMSGGDEVSAEPVPDEGVPETSAEPVSDEGMSEISAEPVSDEGAPETSAEPEEPALPEIDMSNPNKELSADEIAALFASAGSGSEPPEHVPADPNDSLFAEPEEELPSGGEETEDMVSGEEGSEAAEEPESPTLPEIDMSNPNKELSADEIAALFASAGGNENDASSDAQLEEQQEEATEMPANILGEAEAVPEVPEAVFGAQDDPFSMDGIELLDAGNPNKELSADEIASLFASTDGGNEADGTANTEESETDLPLPESIPDIDESAASARPDIDITDPNQELTFDEITSLFFSNGEQDKAPEGKDSLFADTSEEEAEGTEESTGAIPDLFADSSIDTVDAAEEAGTSEDNIELLDLDGQSEEQEIPDSDVFLAEAADEDAEDDISSGSEPVLEMPSVELPAELEALLSGGEAKDQPEQKVTEDLTSDLEQMPEEFLQSILAEEQAQTEQEAPAGAEEEGVPGEEIDPSILASILSQDSAGAEADAEEEEQNQTGPEALTGAEEEGMSEEEIDPSILASILSQDSAGAEAGAGEEEQNQTGPEALTGAEEEGMSEEEIDPSILASILSQDSAGAEAGAGEEEQDQTGPEALTGAEEEGMSEEEIDPSILASILSQDSAGAEAGAGEEEQDQTGPEALTGAEEEGMSEEEIDPSILASILSQDSAGAEAGAGEEEQDQTESEALTGAEEEGMSEEEIDPSILASILSQDSAGAEADAEEEEQNQTVPEVLTGETEAAEESQPEVALQPEEPELPAKSAEASLSVAAALQPESEASEPVAAVPQPESEASEPVAAAPQPVPEPVKPKAAPKPVKPEKPVMTAVEMLRMKQQQREEQEKKKQEAEKSVKAAKKPVSSGKKKSNKVMSPDDIAALFASSDAGT